MRRKASAYLAVGCALVILTLTPIVRADDPCSKCGYEPHWVDTCPPDIDEIPTSTVKVGIDLTDDCNAETTLIFSGGFNVARSPAMDDSVNFPGTRPVDTHLDVIDTEIVDMELTGAGGITLIAGAGLGNDYPLVPSPGVIAEDEADPLLASAFFHVYFEIDLGSGVYGYNHEPLILTVDPIQCVPPDVSFIAIACLELFDRPLGEPDPIQVGRLTIPEDDPELYHDTYAIPTVSQWGLAVMVLLVLSAGTILFRRYRAAAA